MPLPILLQRCCAATSAPMPCSAAARSPHRLIARSKDFLRLAFEAFLFLDEHFDRGLHFIPIEIGEVGTQLVLFGIMSPTGGQSSHAA